MQGQVSGLIHLEGDAAGTQWVANSFKTKVHQLGTHQILFSISGKILGLAAGKHGFHVHEFGDTGDKCKAAGGHYNPFNRNHGDSTSNVWHELLKYKHFSVRDARFQTCSQYCPEDRRRTPSFIYINRIYDSHL